MINIVIATDDNYIQHCSVMMTSVLENNENVHFFVLTEGLIEDNKQILRNIEKKYNSTIDFCIVDSNVIKHFPMPSGAGDHISIATYYRLMMEFLIPPSIDRVLYMDCDIIVRSSLLTLFEENLNGYALGAVYQPIRENSYLDFKRLGIESKSAYFNAGVLLVNLDYWRKHNVTMRLLDFIKMRSYSIKQHDQDVLNAVLYNEVKPLSNNWNWLSVFYLFKGLKFPSCVDYSKPIADPAVIHFVSVPKPWEYGCDNPYKKDYYKYIKLTVFRDWRPRFDIKKYGKQVLLPKAVNFINMIDVFNIRKRLFK